MNEAIIWNIIEILASLTECCISTFYVINFLTFKNQEKKIQKYLLLFTVTACNNLIISMLINISAIIGTLQLIIALAFSLLFLNGSYFKKIFVSFSNIFFILIINSAILAIFSMLLNEDIQVLTTSIGIFKLIMLFISKVLYFISAKIIIKIFKKNEHSFLKEELIYAVCIFTMMLIIGDLIFKYILKIQNINNAFFYMLFVSLISANIFFITIIKITNKTQRGKFINRHFNKKKYKKLISKINGKNKKNKELQHKSDEVINTAIKLIKSELYSEAKSYLEHIYNKEKFKCIECVNTDSPVIDAVINSKLYKCQKKNIVLNINVTGSVGLFPENDLAVILSTVLELSIDKSCSDSIRHKINLKIIDNGDFLCISIRFDYESLTFPKVESFTESVSTNPNINKYISKYCGTLLFNNKINHMDFSIWLRIDKALFYLKNSRLTAEDKYKDPQTTSIAE